MTRPNRFGTQIRCLLKFHFMKYNYAALNQIVSGTTAIVSVTISVSVKDSGADIIAP